MNLEFAAINNIIPHNNLCFQGDDELTMKAQGINEYAQKISLAPSNSARETFTKKNVNLFLPEDDEILDPENYSTSLTHPVEQEVPNFDQKEYLDAGMYLAELCNGAMERRLMKTDQRCQRVMGLKTLSLNDKWSYEVESEYEAHKKLVASGEIYDYIKKEREILNQISEEWIQKVDEFKNHPFNLETQDLYDHLEEASRHLFIEKKDMFKGEGGIYRGETKDLKIGVKVLGQSACELNNNRCRSSAIPECKIRPNIKKNQGVPRDGASYEFACHIGLGRFTPPTIVAIIENKKGRVHILDQKTIIDDQASFADLSDRLEGEELEKVGNAGTVSPQKLCSIQRWQDNAIDFEDFKEKLIQEYGKDKIQQALSEKISFEDYEAMNVLAWTTGDTDFNLGNVLLFLMDQLKDIYGLIKIDNSNCFPETNEGLKNSFKFITHFADRKISEPTKQIILAIKEEHFKIPLERYGLTDAISATRFRIETMQEIIRKYPHITHFEMNHRLSLLGERNDQTRALSILKNVNGQIAYTFTEKKAKKGYSLKNSIAFRLLACTVAKIKRVFTFFILKFLFKYTLVIPLCSIIKIKRSLKLKYINPYHPNK